MVVNKSTAQNTSLA